MNKLGLKKERKKIDKIDQQLFKLIKKRTIIVKKCLLSNNKRMKLLIIKELMKFYYQSKENQ